MRFHTNSGFINSTKVFSLISIFLFAGVVMAKEFWESKDFSKWSQKECQKMLNDSPWAKELNLTGSMGFGGGGTAATDSYAPYVKYNIQLRSAAPIRQAIVRQMQIAQKYDSLPADRKQVFDQNNEAFLAGASPDYVMVFVTFETNNRDYLRDLLRHWETQTTELLQNSVYLSNSKAKKVPIYQYIPGSGSSQEFQFIFPRKVDGGELLDPGDKSLQLEFDYPVIGRIGDGRGFIEFKTDKMKIDNVVIY
ncbi:MAG: hypothetical protein FWF13_05900 [Acidobacteria bacterium]|nr:hypothetical protein [Acidobacteriota bacterium]